MTNNPSLEAEGEAERREGKVQEKIGKVRLASRRLTEGIRKEDVKHREVGATATAEPIMSIMSVAHRRGPARQARSRLVAILSVESFRSGTSSPRPPQSPSTGRRISSADEELILKPLLSNLIAILICTDLSRSL